MQQIIEGLDNEVALLLFFTTAVLAVVFPLYIAKLFQPTVERAPVEERIDNQLAPPPDEALMNIAQGNDNQLNDIQENTNQDIVDNDNITSTTEEIEINSKSVINNESVPTANHAEPTEDLAELPFVIKVKLQEEVQEQNVTKFIKLMELKQRCFPEQFTQGKQIRFIHAGKLLIGDDSTLQQLGIVKPCVLQCVISEQRTPTATATPHAAGNVDNDLLDLSSMMYICYGALIIGSWTLLFFYDDLFSTFGMFILSILSVIAYFLVF